MFLSPINERQTASANTSALTIPEEPAAELSQLKELLRIDDDAQDGYLSQLLLAASQYAVQFLNRSLRTQSWKRTFDAFQQLGLAREHFAQTGLFLPYGPVKSISKLVAVSQDGTETDVTNFYLNNSDNEMRIYLKQGVSGRGFAYIIAEYVAGYGAIADVPALIQQGILQHAAYLFEHRGDCGADEAAKLSGAKGMYGMYRVGTAQ